MFDEAAVLGNYQLGISNPRVAALKTNSGKQRRLAIVEELHGTFARLIRRNVNAKESGSHKYQVLAVLPKRWTRDICLGRGHALGHCNAIGAGAPFVEGAGVRGPIANPKFGYGHGVEDLYREANTLHFSCINYDGAVCV